MPRKKKVAEPPSVDAELERHVEIMNKFDDVMMLVMVAILAAGLAFLAIATVVVPELQNMNARLDTVQMMQIEQHKMMVAQANETSPFCYGYDAYGQKGWGIDISKVTQQCEVS